MCTFKTLGRVLSKASSGVSIGVPGIDGLEIGKHRELTPQEVASLVKYTKK